MSQYSQVKKKNNEKEIISIYVVKKENVSIS